MSDVDTRDPCDGCDGECGDVCPVLESQRLNRERAAMAEVPDLMAALEASLSDIKRPAADGGTGDGATRRVSDVAARVVAALADGPKSSRELGVEPAALRDLEALGTIKLDPDRWPDEYVPGNPLVARLPNDDRRWPGWARWNV